MDSPDDVEELQPEDAVDMLSPHTGGPEAELTQRLQELSTEDGAESDTGTNVELVTGVVDALQSEFSESDVSIDWQTPDSDVTVQVVVSCDTESTDELQEQASEIVAESTADTDATVSVEVVPAPTPSNTEDTDEDGVVVLD